MSKPVFYALVTATLGIIVKLLIFFFYNSAEGFTYATWSYLLFLLIAISLSIRNLHNKKSEKSLFKDYFKEGLKAGGVFAVVIGIFTFFYYNNIDKKFLETKISQRIEFIKAMPDEEFKKQIKPLEEKEGKTITKEEIIQREKKKSTSIYSPKFQSSMTLFGFMMLSVIYSAIIAGIAVSKFFPKI